jgi:hypothetical protein
MSGLAVPAGPTHLPVTAIAQAVRLHVVDRPFDQKLGTGGYELVGRVYGPMNPDDSVYISMPYSSGMVVRWKIYNADGHHLLNPQGRTITMREGETTIIWTNNSGRPIKVLFEAEVVSDQNRMYRIYGHFLFHTSR